MRILVIVFTSVLLFTGCKVSEEQAAATAAEDKAWYDLAVDALNKRDFVLEADRIDFRRGRYAYVTANTNFVSVSGNKATIQMAFNSPYAGPNGIGGITVDGTASNVKMEKDKKGNITFSMMVQGIAVSANVTLRMMEGSNKCTATVTPNFNSNRISFSGSLYPTNQSNVYKGRSL